MCPMAADAFTVHVSTGDGSSLHLLLIDQESKRYYCRTVILHSLLPCPSRDCLPVLGQSGCGAQNREFDDGKSSQRHGRQ